MGEQPGPVEEELERALVSMRVGFLSGSSQIAAGLASLDAALADAPEEERERIRVAVTQIVGTQARLTAKMERLPAVAWDRFKIMVSVVKAQQIVLDQLGDLVQKHVLPRQIESLSIASSPESGSPPPPTFLDDPPRPSTFASEPPPPAYESAPRGESFMRAQQGLQVLDAQRGHQTRRARHQMTAEDDDPRSVFARMRDRTTGNGGLATMIVAAVVLSLVPSESRLKLQDFTAKVVAMLAPAVETAPSGGANATAQTQPPPASPPAETVHRPAETVHRPAERARPQSVVAGAADRPDGTDRPAAQKPAPKSVPKSVQAPPEVAAVAPRPEPPDSTLKPDEREAPAPAPAEEPAGTPEEQFVPVVFTHKNYETVMQAMADLKQRFPNILIGRKGEVQPVDLGKKGTWHRLVFLPAVPRPEAARLCDQLMARGYDRCWVKEY